MATASINQYTDRRQQFAKMSCRVSAHIDGRRLRPGGRTCAANRMTNASGSEKRAIQDNAK